MMRIFFLLLHALQRLTICSKISLAICVLSAIIYLAPDFHSASNCRSKVAPATINLNSELFDKVATKDVAKLLEENIRILCICTALNPGTPCSSIEHARETWGKRCTRWVDAYEKALYEDAYNITLNETTNDLAISYTLSKPIYPLIYDRFRNDYDWFLRTTEVAYIIMENLRVFLGQFNETESHLFGYEASDDFVLDTAYVFSRGALERLVDEAISPIDYERPTCLAPEKMFGEHLITGECFKAAHIYPEDSRDHFGRPRFVLLFNLWDLLLTNSTSKRNYLLKKIKGPLQDGVDQCCAESAFALHAGGHPAFTLAFEYLLYRLYPVGVTVTHVLPQSDTLLRNLVRKRLD